MDFVRERGEATIQPYHKATATVIEAGDLLATASGLVVKADETDTAVTIIGVAQESILAADAKTSIDVDTGRLNDEFRAVVGTGTATAAMEGLQYGLDSDGLVDVTETTLKVVEIVRYVSATEVIVKLIPA